MRDFTPFMSGLLREAGRRWTQSQRRSKYKILLSDSRIYVNECNWDQIHASLELLALSIVGIELFMKYRWMKTQHFLRHTRTAIKSVVLLIMICEAMVVLIRRDSHFRVTRALRPVFLIDNHYCGGIRRVVRQILQSLPPFLDMLFLLVFFMLVFAILGFYLFSSNPSDPVRFKSCKLF